MSRSERVTSTNSETQLYHSSVVAFHDLRCGAGRGREGRGWPTREEVKGEQAAFSVLQEGGEGREVRGGKWRGLTCVVGLGKEGRVRGLSGGDFGVFIFLVVRLCVCEGK